MHKTSYKNSLSIAFWKVWSQLVVGGGEGGHSKHEKRRKRKRYGRVSFWRWDDEEKYLGESAKQRSTGVRKQARSDTGGTEVQTQMIRCTRQQSFIWMRALTGHQRKSVRMPLMFRWYLGRFLTRRAAEYSTKHAVIFWDSSICTKQTENYNSQHE